jgi:chromosome segregation ATPase
MHGLHIALAACRKHKEILVQNQRSLEETLHQTSAQHMLEVVMAKEERDTMELSLELKLEVANSMLRTYEEREDRETRLEQSLQIRKELCDVAEAALTAARDRINSLEGNLSSALRRVRDLEDEAAKRCMQNEAAAARAEAANENMVESHWELDIRHQQQELGIALLKDALVPLDCEIAEMNEHMQMLTEKNVLLQEQLSLSQTENDIMTKNSDKVQCALDAMTIHFQAIQAQIEEEAQTRAQQQVQEHLARQLWLETALRAAFEQENALRALHGVKDAQWAERCGAMRVILSKQARLLSLRQVSRLTGGLAEEQPGLAKFDVKANAAAIEAAAALESEITRLTAVNVEDASGMMLWSTLSKMQQHDAGEPESTPSTPRTSHQSPPRRYLAKEGAHVLGDGGGGGGGQGGQVGTFEEEERLRHVAHQTVIEDLVRRTAEAECGCKQREAEISRLRRQYSIETHRLQAQVRAAESMAQQVLKRTCFTSTKAQILTHLRHQQLHVKLTAANTAVDQATMEQEALRQTLQALNSSLEDTQWAKSACGSKVKEVLEQRRDLQKKLALADDTVRELVSALKQHAFERIAHRAMSMRERARAGRREQAFADRILVMHSKLQEAEVSLEEAHAATRKREEMSYYQQQAMMLRLQSHQLDLYATN